MKIRFSLLAAFLLLSFFYSCKKDDPVPSYPPGNGIITGSSSTGFSFSVSQPAHTILSRMKASGFNGDNTDNLLIHCTIDQAIGKSLTMWLGKFDGKKGDHILTGPPFMPLPVPEPDGVTYTLQNSPQIDYVLTSAAGEISKITITRIVGSYMEGTYIIRLGTDPFSTPLERIEGTFRGNFRNE